MISSTDVKIVQKSFSDAAGMYDRMAFIQNDIRRELLAKLEVPSGATILDVGCGTGVSVDELSVRDPLGIKVGVDIAGGMLALPRRSSRRGYFVQADGCVLPFGSNVFDAVVSSSAYQWSSGLDEAFGEAFRVLKPGGHFQVALFGKETLHEVFSSLRAVSPSIRERMSTLAVLPTHGEVRRALDSAGFSDAIVLSEHRRTVFRDLWSLMVWMKSVGANSLGRGIFLGKQAIVRAQDHYAKHYSIEGGLSATFEVVWIEGVKR